MVTFYLVSRHTRCGGVIFGSKTHKVWLYYIWFSGTQGMVVLYLVLRHTRYGGVIFGFKAYKLWVLYI